MSHRHGLADMDEPRARLPWPIAARIIFMVAGLLWAAVVFGIGRL